MQVSISNQFNVSHQINIHVQDVDQVQTRRKDPSLCERITNCLKEVFCCLCCCPSKNSVQRECSPVHRIINTPVHRIINTEVVPAAPKLKPEERASDFIPEFVLEPIELDDVHPFEKQEEKSDEKSGEKPEENRQSVVHVSTTITIVSMLAALGQKNTESQRSDRKHSF